MNERSSPHELERYSVESIENLYAQLMDLSPKIVTMFTPSNRAEQEEKFLSGEVRNPQFVYEKLGTADFEAVIKNIQQLGDSILNHPDLPSRHRKVYEEFIKNYQKQTELLLCAQMYHVVGSEYRQDIAERYARLNVENYGEPEEETYRSLLGEKLKNIHSKKLTGKASKLREELFGMVDFDSDMDIPERFRPSDETVEWIHDVARSLYGGMLSHVPVDKSEFCPHELQEIFVNVIQNEFNTYGNSGGVRFYNGAAEGWRVSVEEAGSINVRSSEKKIVIPDNGMMRSREKVEELIVHEIGVHMLRAITGGETDVPPLANGLSGYYDTEEGLGVVMEQALRGKFAERGVDHYITAGLAHYDKKDFRGAFEVKWRLSLLNSIKDGDDISDKKIEKAKKTAFAQTLRSFRGTNDMPLFKDLSYYNGSVEVWRYIDSMMETVDNRDLKLFLLLAGKASISVEHRGIVLDSKTK